MRRAFTLIELLVVMTIMGLMGTAAVGGYRAMQRGMEERGVMQNANAMIRAAYQRAQIDRQPTAVFFWNETLRGRNDEENEIVVGRAVAVRRNGRLSNVFGAKLVDEFADLNLSYPSFDDDDEGGSSGSGSKKDVMYLYPMEDLQKMAGGTTLKRSIVRSRIEKADEDVIFLSGNAGKDDGMTVPAWAFQVEEAGGVSWKPGMAYGCEFLSVQLPHGYIFGSDYSTSADSPVRSAGTFVFKPGKNSLSGLNTDGTVGKDTISIYSLRPNGALLKAEAVGTTDSPEKRM